MLSGNERCAESSPVIEGRYGGAFVTFWSGDCLRGCVGRFGTTENLVGTVKEVTRQSLTDSRFRTNPISKEELQNLRIEISVLSDLAPLEPPDSLVCGTHGILIRKGHRSGCFLPKVATERGWTAEEFLSNCCTMKAGLPADAWRHIETEVSAFTAEVFCELQDTRKSSFEEADS